MRLSLLGRISLTIIVVTLGLLAAVPSWRQVALPSLSSGTQQVDYYAEAQRRPDDAKAWLAVFSGAARIGNTGEELDVARARARQRLLELRPDSPVPYVLDGARGVPLQRAEMEAWIGDWLPGHAPTVDRPLTASERDRWEVLWEGLHRARELDPDNAAVDYLLIYLALADHRDAEAADIMRHALAKKGWDLYQPQAMAAAYSVNLTHHSPEVAAMVADVCNIGPYLDFLQLTRVLTGMALLAAQRGDHTEAVFLYQSAIDLAQHMVRDSRYTEGVLCGLVAWSSVVGPDPRVSGEAAQKTVLSRGEDASAGHSSAEREGRFSHAKTCQGLVRYLRAHGADGLADEVLDFSRRADEASRGSGARASTDYDCAIHALVPMYRVRQSRIAAAGGLGTVVVGGLVWLALALLGRPLAPVRWSFIGWAALVLVSLFAAIRASFAFAPGVPTLNRPLLNAVLDFRGWTLSPVGECFVAVGFPLVLAGVLAVVVIVRRRHPAAHAVGLTGSYIATAIGVLLPVAAVLCLTFLGTTAAAALASGRQTKDYEAIIARGDLPHYGLEIDRAP